jgi:hypothetical protein
MPASTVDARLVGNVQSESLIEISIGEELIDALGGRATVDGELRIGFRAADNQRDVFSVERVRLDFLPDRSAPRASGWSFRARSSERRASEWLRSTRKGSLRFRA